MLLENLDKMVKGRQCNNSVVRIVDRREKEGKSSLHDFQPRNKIK